MYIILLTVYTAYCVLITQIVLTVWSYAPIKVSNLACLILCIVFSYNLVVILHF